MNTAERYRINTASFAHYWTEGIGKQLLQQLGYQPDLNQADRYVPYLFKGDEAADRMVECLHLPVGFPQAQQLIADYIQHPSQIDASHKGILNQFFSGIRVMPDWLDWSLLQKGLDFSQRSGLSGLIVLRDYCLMGGYESAAINKPLIYTGALKKGAVKRLSETVEFWVNITGNDALKYGSIGFNAVIKTRMIHAFARINILRSTDWAISKWGIPLNAWDMLATNLGFSLVYLVGLRKMGIHPLAGESRGLFHLWKYIGYLLGIPLEILPNNENEAIEALYYWTMTQADGDADSKALAKALQEEPIRAYYPTSQLGRKMMREIHLFYNHYLLGDYSCDLLGLDQTILGRLAYLNIWKNRLNQFKAHNEDQRYKLVQRGRITHERVKAIYLKWNAETK